MASDRAHPDQARSGPGPMLTTVLSFPRPEVAVCTVTGEVDLGSAPLLREQLEKAAARQPRFLVVDFTAVTFFAAAGIRVLDDVRGKPPQRHEVVLVGNRRPVTRVLDLCGAPYPCYGDLDRALAACDGTSSD